MNPLASLRDIQQPAPPPWTPQTPAWYVLGAILLAVVIWAAWRWYRAWRANAYRRAALEELRQCPDNALDALLKRVALVAWPREQVAQLSGREWLAFLDRTGNGSEFTSGAGHAILDFAYRRNAPGADSSSARAAAADWIRNHRVRV